MGELIVGIAFLFLFILIGLGPAQIFWDMPGVINKLIAIVICIGGLMLAGWIMGI